VGNLLQERAAAALLERGVEAVHLLQNGEAVYGPMSLRPAQ